MSSIQVVIPVYNERAVLPELHARLVEVLEDLSHGYSWSVTYVDDGSTDGTVELLRKFCEEDHRVGALELSRNFGQQLAITAGLSVADADAVVLMDGDLQDPPEVIPDLVEEWEAGHDVVYAIKEDRKEGWLKRVLFDLFYRILRKLSSVDIPAHAGNFSLMDRSVVEVIDSMPERNRYISGLRAYVGGRQTGVRYERGARGAGDPRQTPGKLLKMAADAFFAFSEIPLRIATAMGGVVSVVAFVVLLNVLYQKLVSGEAILGWASVMTSILFLGGVQLLAIGIIGEYLGRVYNETKRRPPYVIAQAHNLADDDPSSSTAGEEGRAAGTSAGDRAPTGGVEGTSLDGA